MQRNFAEETYSECFRSSSRIDWNRDSAAGSEPDDVDVAWEDEESWNDSERLGGEGLARRLRQMIILCALHCLPDALKAKLAGSDESRVKFASLNESVHSLSNSDALKLYANEIVGGKTTLPGSSSAEVRSSWDGSSVTISQSTVLTKYFAELKSLLVQSPGIEAHVEKSL